MSSSQPTTDHVAFPFSGQGVPHVTASSRGRRRPHPVATSSRGRGRSGAAPCKMPPVPHDMSQYAALPAAVGEGGGFALAQPDIGQNQPAATQFEMAQAGQGNATIGAPPAAIHVRQAAAIAFAPPPSHGSGSSGSNIFSGLHQTNAGTWTARYYRKVIGTFTTAEAAQHAYSTFRKAITDSGLPVRFADPKFVEIFGKAVREVRAAALADGCLVASEPLEESIAKTGAGATNACQAETATGNAPSQGGSSTRPRSGYVQQTRAGTWTARILVTGTRRGIGTFTTAEAAFEAFETVQNAFEGCTLNKYDLKRMEIFEKAKKEARDAALANGCLTTKAKKTTGSKGRPLSANSSNPLQGCSQSPATGTWQAKYARKVIGSFTTAEAAQHAYETVRNAIVASGLVANNPMRNQVFEEAKKSVREAALANGCLVPRGNEIEETKKSVREAALADGCLVPRGNEIEYASVPTVLDTADDATESSEFEGPGDSLRRGKWTPEEEEYAKKAIADFHAGVLRAPPGTMLRKYLSEKLNCDPMRISKKFEGELAVGTHNFRALPRTVDNAADIDKAQSELDELEKLWRERLERDGIGKQAKRNSAVIYKNMAIHKAVVEAAAKASESYVQKAREESAATAVAAGGYAAEAAETAASVAQTHADNIATAAIRKGLPNSSAASRDSRPLFHGITQTAAGTSLQDIHSAYAAAAEGKAAQNDEGDKKRPARQTRKSSDADLELAEGDQMHTGKAPSRGKSGNNSRKRARGMVRGIKQTSTGTFRASYLQKTIGTFTTAEAASTAYESVRSVLVGSILPSNNPLRLQMFEEAKKEARNAALASGCLIETSSPTPKIQVNAADIPVEAAKYGANAKKRGRGRPRKDVDPFVGPLPSKRCCRPRESVDPRIAIARQILAMQKQSAGPTVEIVVQTIHCMPASASEVDFDIHEPPMTPIVKEGSMPVCNSNTELNEHDVLLGRGPGAAQQIGNQRFRHLVRDFQPTYLLAKKKEKSLLARSIVLIVRKRGGRFVKKDDKTGGLYEIGDTKAEFKAAQLLREGLDIQGTKRKHGDSAAQKQSEVPVDADMPSNDGSTNMEVQMDEVPFHFAKTNGITDDVAELAESILAERDAKMKIDAPSVVDLPVPVHVDLDLEGVQGGYELDDEGMEEGSEEGDEWTSEVAEV